MCFLTFSMQLGFISQFYLAKHNTKFRSLNRELVTKIKNKNIFTSFHDLAINEGLSREIDTIFVAQDLVTRNSEFAVRVSLKRKDFEDSTPIRFRNYVCPENIVTKAPMSKTIHTRIVMESLKYLRPRDARKTAHETCHQHAIDRVSRDSAILYTIKSRHELAQKLGYKDYLHMKHSPRFGGATVEKMEWVLDETWKLVEPRLRNVIKNCRFTAEKSNIKCDEKSFTEYDWLYLTHKMSKRSYKEYFPPIYTMDAVLPRIADMFGLKAAKHNINDLPSHILTYKITDSSNLCRGYIYIETHKTTWRDVVFTASASRPHCSYVLPGHVICHLDLRKDYFKLSILEVSNLCHEVGHAFMHLSWKPNYECHEVPIDFLEMPSVLIERVVQRPEFLTWLARSVDIVLPQTALEAERKSVSDFMQLYHSAVLDIAMYKFPIIPNSGTKDEVDRFQLFMRRSLEKYSLFDYGDTFHWTQSLSVHEVHSPLYSGFSIGYLLSYIRSENIINRHISRQNYLKKKNLFDNGWLNDFYNDFMIYDWKNKDFQEKWTCVIPTENLKIENEFKKGEKKNYIWQHAAIETLIKTVFD
eukprot:GHVL01029388.1.p1 GENE.GHVL01029388.1~~GHVL01029388.1.p1  ORF type:complete len:613 (+),score=81.39 GHVL01029388.1:89-1840(+)